MPLNSLAQVANDEYRRYSEQTSSITRSLALAGVALVWLYRTQDSGITALPAFTQTLLGSPILLIVLLLFVAALVADLMQYTQASYKWLRYRNTIARIADYDDFSNALPTDRALKAWSNRYGLDLANSISYQVSKSPGVLTQFTTASPNNGVTVWRARKFLDNPSQFGVSASNAQKIKERTFIPRHVTITTNLLFWTKNLFTSIGYILLLGSLVSNILGNLD